MLEYPEAKTIARQIGETLLGKTIADVTLEQTPHKFAFFTADKALYASMLAGETIRGAAQHGGFVEINTERAMLYFSDGAFPRYFSVNEKPPAKHQFLLRFTDGAHLAVSIQMYGFIGVSPFGRCEEKYYRLAADKPDPLGPDFTYEYFRGLYDGSAGKMSAKAFLATEQRIPGLGNGVLQDILWNARIHPRRAMNTLCEDDFRTLYQSVTSTLKEMCKAGGRSTEKDLFGRPGGYVGRLSKNTLASPCPRCGTAIEKEAYLGGAVYFCSDCQRKA